MVKQKLKEEEYSLLKRNVSVEDVKKNNTSPIWLFVQEIYPCKVGERIPKKMRPIPGWVYAPDGAIIAKNSGTTSVGNYLANCKLISLDTRKKYFKKGLERYETAKKRRREPNQASLEAFGIQVNDKKRFKRSNTVQKSVLEPSVRKLLTNEIVTAQIDLVSKGLQPPSIHNIDSFREFGQLCIDIGYQLKKNVDLGELMLSGKQVTERNIDEFKVIYTTQKKNLLRAAENKSLSFQIDL